MKKYITRITGRRRRVLLVTLDRKKPSIPIQILTTYSPHNGHTEDRRKRLCDAKEILHKTCKRHMIIWRADANGHPGNGGGGGKGQPGNAKNNIIGPYARAIGTGKEMGRDCRKYARSAKRYRWQHGKPKLENKENGKRKNKESAAKG